MGSELPCGRVLSGALQHLHVIHVLVRHIPIHPGAAAGLVPLSSGRGTVAWTDKNAEVMTQVLQSGGVGPSSPALFKSEPSIDPTAGSAVTQCGPQCGMAYRYGRIPCHPSIPLRLLCSMLPLSAAAFYGTNFRN